MKPKESHSYFEAWDSELSRCMASLASLLDSVHLASSDRRPATFSSVQMLQPVVLISQALTSF
jgi:hypothetical protein